MKAFTALTALGAAISPVFGYVAPRQANGKLTPVTIKGNAFYAGNERFYIRGVAYQPGGEADAADPLVDLEGLKRDIENFKKLGVNTVRIYTVDNSKDHDEAMKMLDEAGIYLALDVNSPKYSLNREDEASLKLSYNDVYLQNVFATVDNFAKYNNLLLFFSANEVINKKDNTNAAPYIKAVTRDMKQYISNRLSRKIPVGYSSADVAENIEQQATYFNCGTDDERSDFFAFNDYSWCDPSSFQLSGWDKKVQTYKDYSIPLFLSEFGCITNKREWNEISALFSDKMSAVYSGGLAYEYTVEAKGYGLVDLKDGKVETNEDFDRLAKAFEKQKNPSGNGGAKDNGAPSKCPPEASNWKVKGTLLPAMPKNAQKFMNEGAGKGVGLSGEGSQWHGKPSEGTATPGAGKPTRTPDGQAAPAKAGGSGGTGAAGSLELPLRFVGMIAASVVFGMALMI